MHKLKRLWSVLRESFWFLPSVIIGLGILLAVALIGADSTVNQQWLSHWPRLFGAGAAGARSMLSTIAGSMMTVVGVTFSMTLVALALASNQYTSRVLRNFIGDRVTQVVLGVFAGIFIYCLIVLRTIRGDNQGAFVPSLAVSFAVILAISGVSVLIYFIHHIAAAIQASTIISSVADETIDAVDRHFPETPGQVPVDDDEEPARLPLPEQTWQAVPAHRNGYVQSVDYAALLRLAREHRTIARMEHGVGEFVVRDTPLAALALEAPPDQEMVAAIQAAYRIDRHRTVEQDSGFGIRQIVDMALRALSPGINDTTTAIMCVDYLGAILVRLAPRSIPPTRRYDEGALRVITIGPTFASLLADSFDQIRASANDNVGVLLRMLGALQTIASVTADPGRRRALGEQVNWIAELGERTVAAPHDRARLGSRVALVRRALEAEPT